MNNSYNIRSVTKLDLPLILSWRNHPNIRQFMFTRHEIDLSEHTAWFSSASIDKRRSLLLVEESGLPFGYVQFSDVVENGIANWGFFVKPNAPKGSGKILGRLALNYAFTILKVYKVYGQALAINMSSINFHIKLGFTQEGVLREHVLIDDQHHSVHCFGLIRHEWIQSTSH